MTAPSACTAAALEFDDNAHFHAMDGFFRCLEMDADDYEHDDILVGRQGDITVIRRPDILEMDWVSPSEYHGDEFTIVAPTFRARLCHFHITLKSSSRSISGAGSVEDFAAFMAAPANFKMMVADEDEVEDLEEIAESVEHPAYALQWPR